MIDVLKQTKSLAMPSQQDELASYGIAMVCKSGTHRSVSAARIVHEVLKLEGYETYLAHLKQHSWQLRDKFSLFDETFLGHQSSDDGNCGDAARGTTPSR